VIPGTLYGVKTVPGTDHAWAVGDANGAHLILHWTGFRWLRMTNPNPPTGDCPALAGVTAISTTSAWAVGSFFQNNDVGGAAAPLTLHWNGTRWSTVASPDPGGEDGDSCLFDVSRIPDTSDVWAVGTYHAGIPDECCWYPLILYWDGHTWSQVPTPPAPGNAHLTGVAATSPTDAWAVGTYGILHWDGTSWSQVADGSFLSVSADSATDAWAVGDKTTYHWDGTSWSQVSSPSPVHFFAVKAMSPTQAWGVGSYHNGGGGRIVHWDGTRWSVVSPKLGGGFLYGVSGNLHTHQAWAVGEEAGRVVILHLTGGRWYQMA